MPLNASGPISLGGATTGQSVNLELGLSATAQISMNDTVVRTLFGKASGAISLFDGYGKSNRQPFSTKVTFTTNTSWAVPTGLGVTAIRAKAWGAGGGGSRSGGSTVGGGGGFSRADISVTAGETLLVAVGGGGGCVRSGGGGTNGGGNTYVNPIFNAGVFGGAGGGYSGVFRNNTASQANALIMAGGGGGGADAAGGAGNVGNGGGGGGLSGINGTGQVPGTSGTQVSAGTVNGSQLQGGSYTGSAQIISGGGGGGYFGGGAAAPTATALAGGGGGGSGFLSTGSTNTTTSTGSSPTAANTGDSDYVTGVGTGGPVGTSGGNGYVVIYY